MKTLLAAFILFLMQRAAVHAEIKRIAEGGVSVTISELMANPAPAVLIFHTPWDQTSINLLSEIENWAGNYPDLTIFFIDVVDERTQVYRQYSLEKIPTILVFDQHREQVGGALYDLPALEEILQQKSLLH